MLALLGCLHGSKWVLFSNYGVTNQTVADVHGNTRLIHVWLISSEIHLGDIVARDAGRWLTSRFVHQIVRNDSGDWGFLGKIGKSSLQSAASRSSAHISAAWSPLLLEGPETGRLTSS